VSGSRAKKPKSARAPNQRSTVYLGDDGSWHGRVTMGVLDDGSPDRRHRRGRSEAEVTEKVRQLEQQRDSGTIERPGRPPKLSEWMATYLDTTCVRLVASEKMSPRTLDDYRSKTRLWLIPLLGEHRIDRLKPDHVDRAYGAMFEAGLSSSTVLKIHRILSRALSVAVKREVITRNPTKLVEPPAPNNTEVQPLSRDEARRVLRAAEGLRNGARWSVALALGVRQGEALGLRWSYIDLESGTVRFWHQLQRAESQHGCADPNRCGAKHHLAPCPRNCRKHRHRNDCLPECKIRSHRCPRRTCDPQTCTKHAQYCPQRRSGQPVFRRRKGKAKLTIQCPPPLLKILKRHRTEQNAQRLAAGDRWENNDLVFCLSNGRPISRSEDWRAWTALLKQANVRDVRVHDGRHTAGTLLIEQGVHIRTVQEILGHSRVTVTEQYTHVASPMAQDAAKLMGDALWT
jgi:integrase